MGCDGTNSLHYITHCLLYNKLDQHRAASNASVGLFQNQRVRAIMAYGT